MGNAPQEVRRTALIAVHGVADQKRGDTAESVAALLAATARGTVLRENRLLHVARVQAATQHQRWPSNDRRARIWKSFQQSRHSDFMASAGSDGSLQLDLGARFTDYLLFKAPAHRAPEVVSVPLVRVR